MGRVGLLSVVVFPHQTAVPAIYERYAVNSAVRDRLSRDIVTWNDSNCAIAKNAKKEGCEDLNPGRNRTHALRPNKRRHP